VPAMQTRFQKPLHCYRAAAIDHCPRESIIRPASTV
jgi:hypothetical protein